MIQNTFLFLKRISTKKEQSLWKQTIKDWQCFLTTKEIKGISQEKKFQYNRIIQQAQLALQEERYVFFKQNLPTTAMWRLYPELKDDTCFLDIEIDGGGKIIVVGISNYYTKTNFFVRNVNLTKYAIEQELEQYSAIITFNGGAFDIPKLEKIGVNFSKHIHIDLKPLCINLGLKGGLKSVEQKLNLKRPPHLQGNPVSLWKALHASGDKEYLELLLDYNKEDIENLKLIMEHVYKQLSKELKQRITNKNI